VRQSGSVYRKLREVRYRHLAVFFQQNFRKTPENCRYNYRYIFKGTDGQQHEVRLCLLHQKNHDSVKDIVPTLLDACEEQAGCTRCDAFIPRFTKEQLRDRFDAELKNKDSRQNYPDICALEWVLERSVVGLPPFTWIQSVYFYIKRKLLKNMII
jgi:hypothetical protein